MESPMKRLALLSLAIVLTACADSLTAPQKAPAASRHDWSCIAGYWTGTGLWTCTDSSLT